MSGTVFFDVDTQVDFLSPSGALYVPGAEALAPRLARLNRYAADHGVRVISTADAHSENDAEFRQWPPHCVAGTLGQAKMAGTLLDGRAVVGSGDYDLGQAAQIIIEKQALDCFTNPNLRRVLRELGGNHYVVYGVVTEYCVRCAVRGLLATGARVELVTDAVESLSADAARETVQEFVAAGGTLTTVDRVCGA